MTFHPKIPFHTAYDVGYGKPPNASRFKKGQSGNANGRPKGSKNKSSTGLERLKDILLDEAYREVEIQDKDGPVKLPVLQAALRSLSFKAAKGQIGAQKLLLQSVSTVEEERKREQLETFDKVSAYKREQTLIRQNQSKAEQREVQRLPHPDDIELNLKTGEVIFHGPVNADDLKIWERLWEHKKNLEKEIGDLSAEVSENETTEEFMRNKLEFTYHVLQLTCLSIMRRWQLPANQLVQDFVLQKLLDQHVRNETEPKLAEYLKNPEVDYIQVFEKRFHTK